MPFVTPAHDEAMNERRIIGGQIRPEESILELKPHYARRIAVDLGDEELSRCDLAPTRPGANSPSSHMTTPSASTHRAASSSMSCMTGASAAQRLAYGDRRHQRTLSSTTVSDDDDRGRTLSSVKTTSPSHTNPKPVSWVRVNGSWKAYTPRRNWMVGAMY